MSDWYSDGVEARKRPKNKASRLFEEGGCNLRCVYHWHADGIFDGLFLSHSNLSFRRDSQLIQRNSPLGNEKVPCAEPSGPILGNQYDQRGGGPDEATNYRTADSCYRSHVGALRGAAHRHVSQRARLIRGMSGAMKVSYGAAGAPVRVSGSEYRFGFPLSASGNCRGGGSAIKMKVA